MNQKGQECCNPFSDRHPPYCKLYNVTDTLIKKGVELGLKIKLSQHICNFCRIKIKNKLKKKNERKSSVAESVVSTLSDQHEQQTEMDLGEAIGPQTSSENESDSDDYSGVEDADIEKLKEITNDLLAELKLPKIDDAKLRGKKYQSEMMKKITTRLSAALFPKAKPFNDSEQIINQLKQKFDETSDRGMKIKVLSVLPKDWSALKTQKTFGASLRMIYQTKDLVGKNGIFCDTTKKMASHFIDQNTVDKVIEYYLRENVSRPCPGIREYVRYKVNGEYDRVPRQLLLMNLTEAYALFQEEYPEHKIGFSKFASLRPKQCVLAGSTHGIHTTCVCAYHQNVKLIFDSLNSQFDLKEHNVHTYRDMINILLCDEPNEKCRLNQCIKCPGIDGKGESGGLRSLLYQIIDDTLIENVTCKQWTNAGCKSEEMN